MMPSRKQGKFFLFCYLYACIIVNKVASSNVCIGDTFQHHGASIYLRDESME
jgi:hypothetical protein